MGDGASEIAHPKFRMWIREDDIVQLVLSPGLPVGLEDALTMTEAMAGLTDGRRLPLLADVHDAGALDRPARVEFGRAGDVVSAIALIVASPLSRMMANFFINVSKPIAPTRAFDDEASAVAWLREFIN